MNDSTQNAAEEAAETETQPTAPTAANDAPEADASDVAVQDDGVQPDDGIDHAARLAEQLSPLDRITALDPAHLPQIFAQHTVERVGNGLLQPNGQAVAGTTYRDGGIFLLSDDHPAITTPAEIRAASVFLSAELYVKYLAERICFSADDFHTVFSNVPPPNMDADRRHLLMNVARVVLDQVWAYSKCITTEAPRAIDDATRAVADNLHIPATKDGQSFNRVELLYAAQGGQFNMIAGVLLHYGRSGDATQSFDAVMLTPPSKPLTEDTDEAKLEVMCLAKEAMFFVQGILGSRNHAIAAYADQLMGVMYKELIGYFGEVLLVKPTPAPETNLQEAANDDAVSTAE